ncbi:MAG: hypothetical protein HGB30_01785 [Holophagaceae bacterium]|nr:hypothetical protein [Holophagaceae bacterium]
MKLTATWFLTLVMSCSMLLVHCGGDSSASPAAVTPPAPTAAFSFAPTSLAAGRTLTVGDYIVK